MEEHKDYNIVRCDEEKPYIFVSYSSADRDIVWRDVEKLQQSGYNIWIDRENLQAGKTWNEKALDAISRLSCKCLIFYLSRNSLRSQPCLEELRQTRAEITKKRHRGDVLDFIPVDVEPINDLVSYVNDIYDLIEEDSSKKLSDKEREAETVSTIMHEFFQNNNAVDRILSMDHPKRRKGYYDEIIQGLPERTCNQEVTQDTAGDKTDDVEAGVQKAREEALKKAEEHRRIEEKGAVRLKEEAEKPAQPGKKTIDIRIIIGGVAAALLILIVIIVGVSLGNSNKESNDKERGTIAKDDDDDDDKSSKKDPTPTQKPAETSGEDPAETPAPESVKERELPGYFAYDVASEFIGSNRKDLLDLLDLCFPQKTYTIGEDETSYDGVNKSVRIVLNKDYDVQILSDEYFTFNSMEINYDQNGSIYELYYAYDKPDAAHMDEVLKKMTNEYGESDFYYISDDPEAEGAGVSGDWYFGKYDVMIWYFLNPADEEAITQEIGIKLLDPALGLDTDQ